MAATQKSAGRDVSDRGLKESVLSARIAIFRPIFPVEWPIDTFTYDPVKAAAANTAATAVWRPRTRLRVGNCFLLMCLLVGIDPPDIRSLAPFGTWLTWINPTMEVGLSTTSASDRIGLRLRTQYEKLHLKELRYHIAVDPNFDEVRRGLGHLRLQARDTHVLVHMVATGMPAPSAAGDVWVFSRGRTEYLPVSVPHLIDVVGGPGVYIIDAPCAGLLMPHFVTALSAIRNSPGQPSIATVPLGAGVRDSIVFLGCGPAERHVLPECVPADLFTSAITTPLKAAVLFHRLRFFPITKLNSSVVELCGLPGTADARDSPLGHLMWILTAVTECIAWQTCKRVVFVRLFRQDPLVAMLSRSFVLASRIMASFGCHVESLPSLGNTADHPLWRSWDGMLTIVLQQLRYSRNEDDTISVSVRGTYEPSLAFFHSIFRSLEQKLSMQENEPPLGRHKSPRDGISGDGSRAGSPMLTGEFSVLAQLPVVLQSLLSQALRGQALVLLCRYVDLGRESILSVFDCGVFGMCLKLLRSGPAEYPSTSSEPKAQFMLRRGALIFLWAKLVTAFPLSAEDLSHPSNPRALQILSAIIASEQVSSDGSAAGNVNTSSTGQLPESGKTNNPSSSSINLTDDCRKLGAFSLGPAQAALAGLILAVVLGADPEVPNSGYINVPPRVAKPADVAASLKRSTVVTCISQLVSIVWALSNSSGRHPDTSVVTHGPVVRCGETREKAADLYVDGEEECAPTDINLLERNCSVPFLQDIYRKHAIPQRHGSLLTFCASAACLLYDAASFYFPKIAEYTNLVRDLEWLCGYPLPSVRTLATASYVILISRSFLGDQGAGDTPSRAPSAAFDGEDSHFSTHLQSVSEILRRSAASLYGPLRLEAMIGIPHIILSHAVHASVSLQTLLGWPAVSPPSDPVMGSPSRPGDVNRGVASLPNTPSRSGNPVAQSLWKALVDGSEDYYHLAASAARASMLALRHIDQTCGTAVPSLAAVGESAPILYSAGSSRIMQLMRSRLLQSDLSTSAANRIRSEMSIYLDRVGAAYSFPPDIADASNSLRLSLYCSVDISAGIAGVTPPVTKAFLGPSKDHLVAVSGSSLYGYRLPETGESTTTLMKRIDIMHAVNMYPALTIGENPAVRHSFRASSKGSPSATFECGRSLVSIGALTRQLYAVSASIGDGRSYVSIVDPFIEDEDVSPVIGSFSCSDLFDYHGPSASFVSLFSPVTTTNSATKAYAAGSVIDLETFTTTRIFELHDRQGNALPCIDLAVPLLSSSLVAFAPLRGGIAMADNRSTDITVSRPPPRGVSALLGIGIHDSSMLRIVTGSAEGDINFWDARNLSNPSLVVSPWKSSSRGPPLCCIAVAPLTPFIASAHAAGGRSVKVLAYNGTNAEAIASYKSTRDKNLILPERGRLIRSLCFHSTEYLLASASEHTVHVHELSAASSVG